MADKRATPQQPAQSAQADARRNKRPAPTIDLTATEMPGAAAEAPPQPQAEADEAPEVKGAPPSDRRQPSFAALAIAAGCGAVAVLAVLFGLWISGTLPLDRSSGSHTASSAVNPALEAGKSASATTERKPAPTADGKDAAPDSAMKSLGVALAALSHRTDAAANDAAAARKAAEAAAKTAAGVQASVQAAAANGQVSQADIDALNRRIAALEAQVKAAHEAVARNSGADSAVRLALGAAALRDAVVSGAPYGEELATVKSLGGDAKALAPLDTFAATGAPTPRVLVQELRGLLPQTVKAMHAQAPSGGFLERLEANAGKLVRVRPIEAPAGDDPSAVLARVEVDAAALNIAGAVADLETLSGRNADHAASPALQKWIATAKARQAAVDAARQYAIATTRALRSE